MKILVLLLLSLGLQAMELQAPVTAYWHLRGTVAEEAEHHDLTIHLIGSLKVEQQTLSLYYYRYGISGEDDGGPERERELLLVMMDQRLDGWYLVTGTLKNFALAQIIGQEVVLPDGFRRQVWPLPPVLHEVIPVEGKEESQSYLLHRAPAP